MAGQYMRLNELLAATEAVPPAEAVTVVVEDVRRRFDATMVSFLIADISGDAVVRLATVGTLPPARSAERIQLPGTVYEQVLRTQRPYAAVEGWGEPRRVIVPVTNRGDTIGLLELAAPIEADDPALHEIGRAAHGLAYIIIANRRFTDLYQWGRRTTPLTLPAEIQHHLLPSALSCEAAQFTVSGALEPTSSIGGDTFDYAADRRILHLSVTDAMGHEVDAALLATLLVAALRGARREGADLVEQARRADRAVARHGNQGMVTGQLVQIDLWDGSTELVNAGHPPPLRLRGGEVEQLALDADLPFGAPFPHSYHVQPLEIRPGDRLVMLTDGMLERCAASAELPALVERTANLHPREVSSVLASTVLRACNGRPPDDATVLCLDWYGTEHRERDAQNGADLTQASPPLPWE
ncbi:PP2C family protein-serine/threonine phosphatase [Salinactinospora qingdaonensis]|uniref:PP2C family protein-serine/threonine phosphatase n=1 Tax=Salinactinospora qingdaonensis TaxID=702744 RepID=A0ABP7FW45_9ACTN